MPGLFDALGAGQPPVNFQQASSLQQSLSPVEQAAPQMGPPSTPQELEQRRSGWQEFIHKLQNDPSVRTAAFMTAAQLMRGPDVGESMAGGIGRAIQLGTLAHSFLGANQQRQMMEQQRMQQEQQKLDEQRRVNDANINQTDAQTAGLQQSQRFAETDHPLVTRSKELKNTQDQFIVDHQEIDQLQKNETANMQREVMAAQRDHLRKDPVRTAGAATQITNDREDRLMRTANPPLEGETPQAYEQRIAQLTLGRNQKSQDAVRVQALQKWLSEADPSDPNFPTVLDELRRLGSPGQAQTTSEADIGAWEKARNAAKPGESYKGPDGNTYIRKN